MQFVYIKTFIGEQHGLSRKTVHAETERTDALVSACLPMTRSCLHSGKHLDKISQHFLSKMLKTGDMTGKFKQTLLLHDVPGIKAKRVITDRLRQRSRSH